MSDSGPFEQRHEETHSFQLDKNASDEAIAAQLRSVHVPEEIIPKIIASFRAGTPSNKITFKRKITLSGSLMPSGFEAEVGNTLSDDTGRTADGTLDCPPEIMQKVMENLFAGNKIAAIKLYHSYSGLDLKRSKEFVEMVETELRANRPGEFKTAPQKSGCSVRVGMIVVALSGFAAGLFALLRS